MLGFLHEGAALRSPRRRRPAARSSGGPREALNPAPEQAREEDCGDQAGGGGHAKKGGGGARGSHKPSGTSASSESEAAQFENGSGDRLIAARVPAFAACIAAARLPPRIAAATMTASLESPNAHA